MVSDEKAKRDTLASDPGNPIFADLADELRIERRYLEAIEVCLAGLSVNPQCHKGRLSLARVYYERGFLPFAVSELLQLHRRIPESRSVRKLLEKLAPDEPLLDEAVARQAVVSETEFDFEQLELIEKEENKGQE